MAQSKLAPVLTEHLLHQWKLVQTCYKALCNSALVCSVGWKAKAFPLVLAQGVVPTGTDEWCTEGGLGQEVWVK